MPSATMAKNSKTPVMVLQELTIKKGFGPPDYQITFQISGSHNNRFDFEVNVAGVKARGSGSSKQIGKHHAAYNALLQLQELGIYDPSDNPVSEFMVPVVDEKSPCKTALNCIVELQNFCLENKIPLPEFEEVSSIGPPHAKEFTFECKIASITTDAKGNTKKMAKQLAAKIMFQRIKDVIPEIITEEHDKVKKLFSNDKEAMSRFNELSDVIPDKSVKIEDIPKTLPKLMSAHNLTYQDFEKDLKEGSEDSLKRILDKLEVSYDIRTLQEKPTIVAVSLKTDTPFVTMGLGATEDKAKDKAFKQVFLIMDTFMKIQL